MHGTTGPHDAFEKVIFLEPYVRLTSGLSCWVTVMAHAVCRVRGDENDPFATILQRLGRLYSYSLCGLGTINFGLCTSKGKGASARAHVLAAILYLRNG